MRQISYAGGLKFQQVIMEKRPRNAVRADNREHLFFDRV